MTAFLSNVVSYLLSAFYFPIGSWRRYADSPTATATATTTSSSTTTPTQQQRKNNATTIVFFLQLSWIFINSHLIKKAVSIHSVSFFKKWKWGKINPLHCCWILAVAVATPVKNDDVAFLNQKCFCEASLFTTSKWVFYLTVDFLKLSRTIEL